MLRICRRTQRFAEIKEQKTTGLCCFHPPMRMASGHPVADEEPHTSEQEERRDAAQQLGKVARGEEGDVDPEVGRPMPLHCTTGDGCRSGNPSPYLPPQETNVAPGSLGTQ